MIDNPFEMIRGIITVAPELNVKVALLNMVDYIEDVFDEDNDESVVQINVENLLEVVVQSIAKLEYDLGNEPTNNVGGRDYDEKKNEITIEEFKRVLGIDPDNDSKEDTDE